MKERMLNHIAVRFSETEKAALDLLTAQHQTTPSQAIRDAVLLAARLVLMETKPDRND